MEFLFVCLFGCLFFCLFVCFFVCLFYLEGPDGVKSNESKHEFELHRIVNKEETKEERS